MSYFRYHGVYQIMGTLITLCDDASTNSFFIKECISISIVRIAACLYTQIIIVENRNRLPVVSGLPVALKSSL